jgi:hypothetical protein
VSRTWILALPAVVQMFMMRINTLLPLLLLGTAMGAPGRDGLVEASVPTMGAAIQAVPVLGLNSHGLEVPHLAALSDLRVRNVRWTIYEDLWNRDRAYREWNTARLRAAIRGGFQVLVVVQGFNTAELARRFPGVEAWQPRNEIDGSDNRRRGREYGTHLREIRRAVPDAFLVASGIAPESAAEFWLGMREAGVEPDAYAVHVYGPPLDRRVRSIADGVLAAADGTPVWITEFGVEARADHGITEQAQLENWRGLLRESAGVFDRVYGYALFTDETGTHGTVEKHGILRPDGSPRPVYSWIGSRRR